MIVSNVFEKFPDVFMKEQPDDEHEYIRMLGRIDNERVYRYIRRNFVQDNKYIDAYKVFIPEANGTGAIGEVVSTPLVGEPLVGVTDTFLCIGIYDNFAEANNTLKYIKTKFVRAMLGILKVTQDNPRSTWRYVPLQDFTNDSDIDWSVSIHEIDLQLYRKYGLNDEEVKFIESRVKEMK